MSIIIKITKLLLKAAFFWRRTDPTVLIVKACLYGVVAWAIATRHTTVRNALVVGVIVFSVMGVRYVLLYRREQAKLLAYVDGDMEKYREIKARLKAGGIMEGLARQLFRAEAGIGGYGDSQRGRSEKSELNDAARDRNRAASHAKLERIVTAVAAHPGVTIKHQEERTAELMQDFANGDYEHDLVDLLIRLYPEREIMFSYEEYYDDDDHAELVKYVAKQTGDAWQPRGCRSQYDKANDNWTVTFTDDGELQTWKFNQIDDWLSVNFLSKLLEYAEQRSGLKILPWYCDDLFHGVLLPPDFVALLEGEAPPSDTT